MPTELTMYFHNEFITHLSSVITFKVVQKVISVIIRVRIFWITVTRDTVNRDNNRKNGILFVWANNI